MPCLPWGLYLNAQTTTRATSGQWRRSAVGKQQWLLSGQENGASCFHCTLPVHGLLTCNFSLCANNKNNKFDDFSHLERGDEMEQQKQQKTWNINGAWHRRQMHITQSIIYAWNVRKRKKRQTHACMHISHRKWENESTHNRKENLLFYYDL